MNSVRGDNIVQAMQYYYPQYTYIIIVDRYYSV